MQGPCVYWCSAVFVCDLCVYVCVCAACVFGQPVMRMGRRGADMRSGRMHEIPQHRGLCTHCPADPFCHFHFPAAGPESGQL